MSGAQFEIRIDGTPRTYRDDGTIALDAARELKFKHPSSEIVMRDMKTGAEIVVEYPKPIINTSPIPLPRRVR